MTRKTILLLMGLLLTLPNVFAQELTKQEKKEFFAKSKKQENIVVANKLKSGSAYSFTATTGTYEDLIGTTSVNNNQIWDDPETTVPIGFDFELFDLNVNTLYLGLGLGGTVTSELDFNYNAEYIIAPFETDLIDRGDITGISQSPISYKLEGTAGSRIFKMEWKNAGFFDEGDTYGTLNDYINFQLWLYEGSNNIEFHFGSSMITDPIVNYYGETGAFIGVADSALTDAYFVVGDPGVPTLSDSVIAINGTPADGTIYTFTKNTIGIEAEERLTQTIKVFPNPFHTSTVLQSEERLDHATVSIHNLAGQQVKEISQLSGHKIIIHREDLPSGIYYLQVREGDSVLSTRKLVIAE